MTSSLPFVPNAEKIIAALQGDIGIAKKLHEATVAPILAGIKDSNTLAKFKELSKPPSRSGLAAFERTTISTMMENFKPLVELALIVLELLSGVEVFLGKSFTGINPYAVAGSFSAGKLLATQALDAVKKAGLAKGSADAGTKPAAVLFGVWDERGKPLVPSPAERKGRLYDHPWQLIRSKGEHSQQRLDGLKSTLDRMREPDKSEFLKTTISSIEKEWEAMSTEGVMFKPAKYYNPLVARQIIVPLRGYLEAATYDDPRGPVEFDPENDYDITIKYENKRHVVYGVLREDAGGLPPGQTGNRPKTPSKSPYIPNPLKAPLLLVQLILPIITKRLMPAIAALQDIIADPAGFLPKLVMAKLKEHIEWMDPTIKSRPKTDELRKKYYDGNTFLLDGVASISLLGFTLTVGLENAVPFFNTSPPEPGAKEQPMLKTIMNLVKMPIEFIAKIVEAFMKLVQKLADPTKIASAVAEFLTFKWLTDILKPESILQMLGVTAGLPGSPPLVVDDASKAKDALDKILAKAAEAKQKTQGEVQGASDKARRETEAVVAKKIQVATDKAKQAVNQASDKAAQVFAVTKQFLVMIQELLNSLVSMPFDIFNLPQSVRDAVPKIAFA